MTRIKQSIDETKIHPDALSVINLLQKQNYEAYLVGGAVRDILLGRTPKDFDVVTNAQNSEIAEIFPSCELIGRRFPIALIHFDKHYIEVSTFVHEDLNQVREDYYLKEKGYDRQVGTLAVDSYRRDFSINALYYDLETHEIIDLENGLQAINDKTIVMIGDVNEKTIEDPVRIIRGIRQAAQLTFSIAPETLKAFEDNIYHLEHVSKSRLKEEIFKTLRCGACLKTFQELHRLNVFEKCFPFLHEFLVKEFARNSKLRLAQILEHLDDLTKQFGQVRESVIFTSFLLPAFFERFPNIFSGEKVSIEEIFAFTEEYQDLLIELSVKRWVKKKMVDIFYQLHEFFIYPIKARPTKFIYKEYFIDCFRFFRFIIELNIFPQTTYVFWANVRKNNRIYSLLANHFNEGGEIDEKIVADFSKETKSFSKKPFRKKRFKKRRH